MATKKTRTSVVYGYANPQTALQQEPIIQQRNPTPADSAQLGTVWINSAINSFWILTNTTAGINTWSATSGGATTVTDLTVDPGDITVVFGDVILNTGNLDIDSGNINLPVTTDINHGTITLGGNSFAHSFGVCNTFYGQNAGNFTTTGTRLTGIGCSALHAVTTGSYNTALGNNAQEFLTSGSYNVALGSNVQGVLTTGNHNTSIGSLALALAATNSARNTTVGFSSLTNATNPADNIVIGYLAGSAFTTNEDNNIVIGSAGVVGDSGAIRIGTNAVHTSCYITGIDTVDLNTAKVVTELNNKLGSATLTAGAGIAITPGANIITIEATGGTAAVETITGNSGGALPPAAGNIDIVTANSTVTFAGAVSTETLDFDITNLTLGSALPSLAGGSRNVGMGSRALHALTSATDDVALGWNAGASITTGAYSTFVGSGAGDAVTTGTGNTAIGYSALTEATTGAANAGVNTAIGYNSLVAVTTGIANTALAEIPVQ